MRMADFRRLGLGGMNGGSAVVGERMVVGGPMKETTKHNNHRAGASRWVQCCEKAAMMNWRSSLEAVPMLKPRAKAKKRRKACGREATTPARSKSTKKDQIEQREGERIGKHQAAGDSKIKLA